MRHILHNPSIDSVGVHQVPRLQYVISVLIPSSSIGNPKDQEGDGYCCDVLALNVRWYHWTQIGRCSVYRVKKILWKQGRKGARHPALFIVFELRRTLWARLFAVRNMVSLPVIVRIHSAELRESV